MCLYGRTTGKRNQTTAQRAGANPGLLKARGLKRSMAENPLPPDGMVERTNEDDAVVKWDDDVRTRVHQLWLKKTQGK